jgi:CheY-like chemotaxis protein
MNDLRTQYQSRFIETANTRLRRALAALATEPITVYNELHSLAGEAGIMGFSDISNAANAGQELARVWKTAKPTSDQQLACARVLRSLIAMVGKMETKPVEAPRAVAAARRALVIDDSEITAEELAHGLREAGFEAAIASTLERVIASLRETVPDVVLVDANIPGVEIRALCDQVRSQAPAAKLVVVSASTEEELRTYAAHAGAHGYVGKLHGTASIVARVRSLVDAS